MCILSHGHITHIYRLLYYKHIPTSIHYMHTRMCQSLLCRSMARPSWATLWRPCGECCSGSQGEFHLFIFSLSYLMYFMKPYIYICIYGYIYTHIYMCIFSYMYIYMYAYTVFIHIYISINSPIHSCISQSMRRALTPPPLWSIYQLSTLLTSILCTSIDWTPDLFLATETNADPVHPIKVLWNQLYDIGGFVFIHLFVPCVNLSCSLFVYQMVTYPPSHRGATARQKRERGVVSPQASLEWHL